MDIYAPLFNGSYYENTLTFLLTEYYNCYKSQKEVINALPTEFTVNDKEFVFTMNLLYGNAYSKKLIFKEILDLTIYYATFIKNIETSNLMKTQELHPNPQIELLSGGAGNMFLQAVFFFSFITLYHVTSTTSQQLGPFCSPNYDCDGIATLIPNKLEQLRKGIPNPFGPNEYDETDPTHVRRYTELFGTSIKPNKQLESANVTQLYKTKFTKSLDVDIQEQIASLIFASPDKFNSYVENKTEELNLLIIELFKSIEESCGSMTQYTDDQLPIELYKIYNAKIADKIDNFAESDLSNRITARERSVTEEQRTKLLDSGMNPGDSSLTTKASAAADTTTNFVSKLLSGSNVLSNSKQVSASSPHPTSTELIKLSEQFNSNLTQNVESEMITIKEEEEANVVNEVVEAVDKEMLSENLGFLSADNRKQYFDTVCSSWFRDVPNITFNYSSGTFSISNSAESFSSFQIILKNIEHNKQDTLANINSYDELKRNRINSLIQKAEYLNGFVNRYNILVFNVMTKGHTSSVSIDNYFNLLQNTVSKLTSDVKIATQMFPIDAQQVLDNLKIYAETNNIRTREDLERHLIDMNVSALQTNMSGERWNATQQWAVTQVSGVMGMAGSITENIVDPLLDGTGGLISKTKNKVFKPFADLIKDILFLGGGVVVVAGIIFLFHPITTFIGATLTRKTNNMNNNRNIRNVITQPTSSRAFVRPSTPGRRTSTPNSRTSRISQGRPGLGVGGKKTRKNKNKNKTRKLKRGKRRLRSKKR
jgi:hypothetical protein